MSLIMYDSIDLTQFHGLKMDAAAGYVDGAWPTFTDLANHVPPGTTLMSITVFGNPATCVDQEPGNIEVAPAARWVRQRIDQGHWRPVVYTSASNMDTMAQALANVGVGIHEVRLWSAHYTHTQHICAPAVCGFPQVDGTQWTDRAHSRNLDESILLDDFFQIPKPSEPKGRLLSMSNITLNRGLGAVTAVAFPVGATKIRTYSIDSATVDVQFLNGRMDTMIPSATNAPEWKIPDGIRAATFTRKDAGINDVSLSMG